MEVNNPVLLGLLDEEVGQCGTTWASSKLGGKPVSVLDLYSSTKMLEIADSFSHLLSVVGGS